MTDDQGRNPATDRTKSALSAFAGRLPADAPGDFENVKRGFIARPDNPVIENTGTASQWSPVTWDMSRWDFVQGEAPDTVNPSLWRQARLNGEYGLFEVIEGFYQVRSLDTSCTTFIRGTDGWVVIDPLTTTETGRAAYDLVREHLEDLPVTAVVYTHTHVDHYGGILGMVDGVQLDDVGHGRDRPALLVERHLALDDRVGCGHAQRRAGLRPRRAR